MTTAAARRCRPGVVWWIGRAGSLARLEEPPGNLRAGRLRLLLGDQSATAVAFDLVELVAIDRLGGVRLGCMRSARKSGTSTGNAAAAASTAMTIQRAIARSGLVGPAKLCRQSVATAA